MKKTAIACALTAICAIPASSFAQSNVVIYGVVRTAVETIAANGATNSANNMASRIRVTDNDSALGFRGEEDLGGGLKAFFQVENSINPSDGGSTWSSRNAGVGLRGSFGEVLMGRWDTYNNTHESIADEVGGKASQVTKVRALITKLGTTEVGSRYNNTLQYTSPNFGGFSGRLQYSAGANEGKTAANREDETVWSGYIQYVNGPVGVQYAYTRQGDKGLVNNLSHSGQKLVASYQFMGTTKLGIGWERLNFDNHATASLTTAGAFDSRRDAWFVSLRHVMGNHALYGTYAKAQNVRGSATLAGANTGATYYQLTYAYMLSKRTNLHATYARVNNAANASYDFHSSGAISGAGAGSNPTAFQVGVVHSF